MRSGFSLLEMLVIMALLAILFVLLVPATSAVSRAGAVTKTGDLISDLLVRARQEAISRNRPTELRIFRVTATGEPGGSTDSWGAAQIWTTDSRGGNSRPVGRVEIFPPGVRILDESGYSPVIADNVAPRGVMGPDSRWQGTDFLRIGFRANGSPDLVLGNTNNFFTIFEEKDTARPPNNFFTLQIHPLTGRVDSHRP